MSDTQDRYAQPQGTSGAAMSADKSSGPRNAETLAGRPWPVSGQSDRLALILSLVFHLSFAAAIGWLLIQNLPEGAGEIESRTGGIVLVDVQSDVTEYLDEGDAADVQQASEPAPAAAQAAAIPDSAPELPGIAVADGTDGLAESIVDALPNVGPTGLAESAGGRSGGKVTTQIFGVSGTGSKFVYVFDRSDSMNGFEQRPIKAAQQELLKSLDSLNESNQFQIIFYNRNVEVFAPDRFPRLYYAQPDHLKDAKRFVRSIRPAGGTDHMQALEYAFRFAPDVIFLLTDAEVAGGFSKTQLARIDGLNRSNAIINVVEFGSYRGQDRSLEKVSQASGGRYVFRNVNSLKLDP